MLAVCNAHVILLFSAARLPSNLRVPNQGVIPDLANLLTSRLNSQNLLLPR